MQRRSVKVIRDEKLKKTEQISKFMSLMKQEQISLIKIVKLNISVFISLETFNYPHGYPEHLSVKSKYDWSFDIAIYHYSSGGASV